MKKLLILVAILAAAGFGGKHLFDNWSHDQKLDTARTRVSGVLHDLAENEEQTALCLWARGGVMMTGDEMSYYANPFDDFVRVNGFNRPEAWTVQEAVGETAAVTVNYGAFIQTVVDFTIIAFAIFMVVKSINNMKKQEEEAPKAPPAPSKEEVLLTEIRDLLKNR